MRKIRVKRYTRKDGTVVRSHLREDKGAQGRTPIDQQWFKPTITLKRLTYTTTNANSTRQAKIREWAKEHGNTSKTWLKLFHHFHGLYNLTKVSNPKAARVFKRDRDYVNSVRKRRFISS